MKTAPRNSEFGYTLVLSAFLCVLVFAGLYAIVNTAPASARAPAEDRGAPVIAYTESGIAGPMPNLIAPSLTSTDSYTTYLPAVMHQACFDIILSGVVYNDLNGNGVRDEAYSIGDLRQHPDGYLGAVGPIQEPPVVGAVVRAGGAASVSDSQGRYALCLTEGTYAVTVEAEPYRFRFPSVHEIKGIGEPFTVNLSASAEHDIGLGIGPFTLPHRLSDAGVIRQASYVDIDPTYDEVGVYNSYPEDCYWWHCTGDAHRGIDYGSPSGTVVVAAAPGFVTEVSVRPGNQVIVFVQHTEYGGRQTGERTAQESDLGLISSYQHLGAAAPGIVPGAFVSRGDPIGYRNDDRDLHFDVRLYIPTCSYRCYVDPYRDLFHDQFAYMEHDSRYGYSIWISWGSPGYWTADNLPCFGEE